MEKITKKKLQEMLNRQDMEALGNQHGNIIKGHRNNQYHQKTRLYGDYLRAQDPEMFNAIYSEYLNGSRDYLNEYIYEK